MKLALISAAGLALLLLLNCGGGRGTSECATPLTYVTNQFTSGEQALRHASEYRLALSVGAADYIVTAMVDTASSNLVINEKNFDFGALTATGNVPFVFGSGLDAATAINAKDSFDLGCMVDKSTRFTLASKETSVENSLGLSFGDARKRPYQGNTPAFFDQLVQEEGIYNIFSLALCRSFGRSRVLLGGIDEAMKPFIGNYIPITELSTYVVPALSLRMGDTKRLIAEFPSYDAVSKVGTRTIVDSATSFLLLPVDMAAAVATEIKNTARSLDLLQKFPEGFFRTERATSTKIVKFQTNAQIRQFPSLEISFRGIDGEIKNLDIPAQQYFKQIDTENPLVRTFAIRETANDIVLGQPFLESHYTVFDRTNARLGFGNIDVACAQ